LPTLGLPVIAIVYDIQFKIYCLIPGFALLLTWQNCAPSFGALYDTKSKKLTKVSLMKFARGLLAF